VGSPTDGPIYDGRRDRANTYRVAGYELPDCRRLRSAKAARPDQTTRLFSRSTAGASARRNYSVADRTGGSRRWLGSCRALFQQIGNKPFEEASREAEKHSDLPLHIRAGKLNLAGLKVRHNTCVEQEEENRGRYNSDKNANGYVHCVRPPIAFGGNSAAAYANRDRQKGTDRAGSRGHEEERDSAYILSVCTTKRDKNTCDNQGQPSRPIEVNHPADSLPHVHNFVRGLFDNRFRRLRLLFETKPERISDVGEIEVPVALRRKIFDEVDKMIA
jgi:hypothetical protein